ncbi:MAG: DUF4058 family protein [Anaerolineae bacterium]
MEVTSARNEYRGVNAQFNSELQSPYGGWEGFHNSHVTDIVRAIRRLLPNGYVIEPEQSFQIRATNPHSGEPVIPKEARPDGSVYHRGQPSSSSLAVDFAPSATLAFDAVEMMDDPENYATAAVIRRYQNALMGDPVAWIEVLSETNLPKGSGFDQYTRKRNGALRSGIVMVEIDYLHECLPVSSRIAYYPDEGEYPYYALVTRPTPTWEAGKAYFYGFHVDEPILTWICIPLLNNDFVDLNLGEVYNQTYLYLFSHRVDYSKEPPRIIIAPMIRRASATQRMAGIIAAHEASGYSAQSPCPASDREVSRVRK